MTLYEINNRLDSIEKGLSDIYVALNKMQPEETLIYEKIHDKYNISLYVIKDLLRVKVRNTILDREITIYDSINKPIEIIKDKINNDADFYIDRYRILLEKELEDEKQSEEFGLDAMDTIDDLFNEHYENLFDTND